MWEISWKLFMHVSKVSNMCQDWMSLLQDCRSLLQDSNWTSFACAEYLVQIFQSWFEQELWGVPSFSSSQFTIQSKVKARVESCQPEEIAMTSHKVKSRGSWGAHQQQHQWQPPRVWLIVIVTGWIEVRRLQIKSRRRQTCATKRTRGF